MRTAHFEIQEVPERDWLRLRLLGEMDMSTGPELEARLEALQSDGRSVLVDLSRLEFMDSTGVAILTRAIHASRTDGWAFVIDHDISPQVRSLMRLSGLYEFAGIDGIDASTA